MPIEIAKRKIGSQMSGNSQGSIYVFPLESIDFDDGSSLDRGGEVLTVRGSKRSLKFSDGRVIDIVTQEHAIKALQQIDANNRLELQSLLVNLKALALTLDHLKNNEPTIKTLYQSIEALRDHAASFTDIDMDRGAAATGLAAALEKMADDFFTRTLQGTPSKEQYEAFEKELTELAYSEDELMGRHRAAWKPILANIVLALTGIGLLFMAMRAVVTLVMADDITKVSINRMFFFGTTQLQNCTSDVSEAGLGLLHP